MDLLMMDLKTVEEIERFKRIAISNDNMELYLKAIETKDYTSWHTHTLKNHEILEKYRLEVVKEFYTKVKDGI